MNATRRWWTAVALGLVLSGWGLVLNRPTAVLGAAGIGAYLIVAQLLFVGGIGRGTVAIDQSLSRSRMTAGETVSLAIDVDNGSPNPVTVDPKMPPSVDVTGRTVDDHGSDGEVADGSVDGRTLRLDAGASGSITLDLSVPIAGTIEVPPPTVVVTDPLGCYEQGLAVGATAEIAVEPRAPRNVHVGTGGEPVAAAFGEHETGRLGAGLEPAEVRKYVPGEAVRRMDWKATARRGEPHVREFEAETDRVTALLLDVRQGMAAGRDGETKLDYARQVALAFADSARELSDPLGCYTVGDGGLTERFAPSTNASRQLAIRSHLETVATTTAAREGRSAAFDPAAARRKAGRLGDDAFGASLRPFLERPRAYVERVESRPLFAATRAVTAGQRGTLWTVILTDDEDRTELQEAVRLARSGGGHVLVFLTPTVLFEPGGLTDLDAAYDRYADFESFRRTLAATDRVQAFEVGPGDRLATVLGASPARRRGRGSP